MLACSVAYSRDMQALSKLLFDCIRVSCKRGACCALCNPVTTPGAGRLTIESGQVNVRVPTVSAAMPLSKQYT